MESSGCVLYESHALFHKLPGWLAVSASCLHIAVGLLGSFMLCRQTYKKEWISHKPGRFEKHGSHSPQPKERPETLHCEDLGTGPESPAPTMSKSVDSGAVLTSCMDRAQSFHKLRHQHYSAIP